MKFCFCLFSALLLKWWNLVPWMNRVKFQIILSFLSKTLWLCQQKIKRSLGRVLQNKKNFFHFLKLHRYIFIIYTNVWNTFQLYFLSFKVKKLSAIFLAFLWHHKCCLKYRPTFYWPSFKLKYLMNKKSFIKNLKDFPHSSSSFL